MINAINAAGADVTVGGYDRAKQEKFILKIAPG